MFNGRREHGPVRSLREGEENETIKEGKTPEDWKSKLAKNRQKDKDARWTKKYERSYFGYKNHIGVDRRHKFVRRSTLPTPKRSPCAGGVHRLSYRIDCGTPPKNANARIWPSQKARDKRGTKQPFLLSHSRNR